MKFLVDESTGKKLASLLEKEGHQVVFVGDVAPSSSDEEIIEKAENEERILLTDDKDFGELVFRLGKPARGVVLLRIPPIPEKRIKALVNLLEDHEVENRFIVLEERAVRSRKIE